MQRQDLWGLAAVVGLMLFGVYAAVVGSDTETTDTPLDRIVRMLTLPSAAPAPRSDPADPEPEKGTDAGDAATTAATFRNVDPPPKGKPGTTKEDGGKHVVF